MPCGETYGEMLKRAELVSVDARRLLSEFRDSSKREILGPVLLPFEKGFAQGIGSFTQRNN